jgi:hypothetical protein
VLKCVQRGKIHRRDIMLKRRESGVKMCSKREDSQAKDSSTQWEYSGF